MEIFIKTLRSQESGYSGDKPNQRGKYIFVPKAMYSIFPVLTKTTLNDTKIIKVITKSGLPIALNIVYHNAKYFPDILRRNHDEVRIYRNRDLDLELSLDREVVVIFIKLNNGEYAVDAVLPQNFDYSTWVELSNQNKNSYAYDVLKGQKRIVELIENTESINSDVINDTDIISETAKIYNKARKQQPGIPGDPSSILSSLIKSQADFSKYIRNIYDNKCALRGVALVEDNFAGLDAAHIQAHSHGGPLLPSNGILLSSDLHQCFDRGYFGLRDDNSLIIRSDVPRNSELYKYNGVIIQPKLEFLLFSPYIKYNQAHRKEHKIYEI